jgi:hypothetical protein
VQKHDGRPGAAVLAVSETHAVALEQGQDRR